MNYHVPALPLTVADIVDEYSRKHEAVDREIAALKAAHDRMETASVVQGVYVENVVESCYVRPDSVRLNLRKSGWKAVFSRLQIDRLASAKDKRLFEQTLADPPELTMDNAKATFGDYLLRPRFHQLRALAECFVQLDPAYKSHSKVRIGVKGLPKRIILSSMRGYGSWGRDRLRDVLNAIAAVEGDDLVDWGEFKALDELCGSWGNKQGTVKVRGVEVRVFQNGNAHVIFDAGTLLTINRALAEFYGEVLPDAEDDDPRKRPGTDVATRLQYYPTPVGVVAHVLDEAGIYKIEDTYRREQTRLRILEPSCGDGRFLDEIRARGHQALGVEIDPGRASQARAKGHAVMTGNFLERPETPEFDYVVMNPPFFGKLYFRHLVHAFKFLKDDGVLASVLPGSAKYGHDLIEKEFPLGKWYDLPVASFSESGTNVPTGYFIVRK